MSWLCFGLLSLLSCVPIWSAETTESSPGCGTPSEQFDEQIHSGDVVGKRVVGGQPTTTKSFPWTIIIKQYGHNGVVCGGAIISRRAVLTAAHCFDEVNRDYIFLWAGKDELDYYNIREKIYSVAHVTVHDSYNSITKENDIAVIETVADMFFNSNVRPVCLPEAGLHLPHQTECFFAGYGDTQGTGVDRRLNYITVPLVADEVCAQDDWLGTRFDLVRNVSFCAGYADGGPDACSGDSGGALVCRRPTDHTYFIYGIASWGKGCGERKKPGVYTHVTHFLSWIQSHVTSLADDR